MGINSCKFADEPINKKVVVIGGSYAGSAIVKLLESTFDVVWVERRPCLVHKMNVRTAVYPEWIDTSLIPSDHMLRRGERIQGNVTFIDKSTRAVSIDTAGGKEVTVNYDYLVIASGATSNSPVEPRFTDMSSSTLENIHDYFKQSSDVIANAKKVVILGGGPVACEMAGEIKERHPQHSVTIVSNSDRLCASMRVNLEEGMKIQSVIQKCGIHVLLGKSVKLPSNLLKESFITGDNIPSIEGLEDKADLIINCTGSTPNTSFVPLEWLNDKQQVKVNEKLQVNNGVYAIGDCNDVKEPKLFVTAGSKKFMLGFPTGQADIVAKNILAIETNGKIAAYTPKDSGKAKVVLPIGKNHHVTINEWGPIGIMKAQSYFYSAHWSFSRNPRAPEVPKTR